MNLERIKSQMVDQIKKELEEQRTKLYDRLEEVESKLQEYDLDEIVLQVDANTEDIDQIEQEIKYHSDRLDMLEERADEIEERIE